jgi:hypothetical protein
MQPLTAIGKGLLKKIPRQAAGREAFDRTLKRRF